jgi:hypothetical protein
LHSNNNSKTAITASVPGAQTPFLGGRSNGNNDNDTTHNRTHYIMDHVIVATGPQPGGPDRAFFSFRENGLLS